MRALLAAAAVALAALAPPSSAAPGYTGTSCGYLGLYDEALQLGNPSFLTDVMVAAVVSTVPGTGVRVTCSIRVVGGGTMHSVSSGAPAPVALVLPVPTARLISSVHDTATLEVCTTVDAGSPVTTCAEVTRSDLPPQAICDLLLGLCDSGNDEYWVVLPTVL